MAVLTGRQIRELTENNLLKVEPFDSDLVQSASYDLRLHYKVLASPVGEKILGKVVDLREYPDGFPILPGQMVGILSFEKIKLNYGLGGESFALTVSLTIFPSAPPPVLVRTSFITLPMSFMPVAPVDAIASSTIFFTSSSDIPAGR